MSTLLTIGLFGNNYIIYDCSHLTLKYTNKTLEPTVDGSKGYQLLIGFDGSLFDVIVQYNDYL